jgi:hypothetical protein
MNHRGHIRHVQGRESPVETGAGRLGRVPVAPGVATKHPTELRLIELRPVLQPRPAKETAAGAIEHGQHAVAALKPLALDEAQAFLGLGLLEPSDEARHFGVVVERDELIDIRQPKGP